MRPLRPDERAELLAAHPDATEEDLDAFEELLVERFTFEPPIEEGADLGLEALAAGEEIQESLPALSAVRALDAKIAEMQRRLFPHYEEALARAAQRRQAKESSA